MCYASVEKHADPHYCFQITLLGPKLHLQNTLFSLLEALALGNWETNVNSLDGLAGSTILPMISRKNSVF